MSLIEPERFEGLLTLEEEEYRDDLQRAYQGCFKELRESVAIKYIQNNIKGRESMYKASRLLDDMQKLYGRFVQKNQLLKRGIVVERMYETAARMKEIADRMYEDDEVLAAAEMEERSISILEKAAKLEGLDKLQTGIDPTDFELPALVITNDARVLKEGIEEAEVDEEE